MTGELSSAFKSGSQQTRVVTESWGEHNLYCSNCPSPGLTRLKNNAKANDFLCPSCGFWYQLKAQKSSFGSRVPDGAYETMMDAIKEDKTPNFLIMQYELATWTIKNLIVIPHFAFPPSAILKRNPTTPKGRSQPWIGCNIALDRIPIDARIALVTDRAITPAEEVRKRFKKVKPLEELSVKERGWTLDVLNVVRSLNKPEFTNSEIYEFVPHFEKLYPGNRHIRDKIRQQLQVLRDRGFLVPTAKAIWRQRDAA